MRDALQYYAHQAVWRFFLVFGLDIKGRPPAISTYGPRTRFEAWWKNAIYDRFSEYTARDTLTKTAVLYRGKKQIVMIARRKYLQSLGYSDPQLGTISLNLDADAKELGKAVTEILTLCTLEKEDKGPLTRDNMDGRARAYTQALRQGLKIGPKAALWTSLQCCTLEMANGVITIEPSVNEGRGGFQFLDPLILCAAPVDDPNTIGLMTYLALRHCR